MWDLPAFWQNGSRGCEECISVRTFLVAQGPGGLGHAFLYLSIYLSMVGTDLAYKLGEARRRSHHAPSVR